MMYAHGFSDAGRTASNQNVYQSQRSNVPPNTINKDEQNEKADEKEVEEAQEEDAKKKLITLLVWSSDFNRLNNDNNNLVFRFI